MRSGLFLLAICSVAVIANSDYKLHMKREMYKFFDKTWHLHFISESTAHQKITKESVKCTIFSIYLHILTLQLHKMQILFSQLQSEE